MTRCCSPPTRPRPPRSGSGSWRPRSRSSRRAEQRGRLTIGAAVASGGRAGPVLGRGGAGTRARHARAGLLRGDGEPVRHRGVFVDGDDTPWSKALLTSAYASRGMKMRVSSVPGAEVLMGDAEGGPCCTSSPLRRAGPRDRRPGRAERRHRRGEHAPSVPRGVRELMCENVMVIAAHGVVLRQRLADVRVGPAPRLADPAHRAGRLGLRVQRVRHDPAVRQHVRPQQVERRGHRRFPGHPAGLGGGRRAADVPPACSGTCAAAPPRRAARSTSTSGSPTSPPTTWNCVVDAAGVEGPGRDRPAGGARRGPRDPRAADRDGRRRGAGRTGDETEAEASWT